MYNENRLSTTQSIFFLLISLLMNALGNGLTVATNMGSPVWTASAANIAYFSNVSIGTVLVLYGLLQIVINCFLLYEINLRRIIGNLIFIGFFGPLVAVSKNFFLTYLHVAFAPLYFKIILAFIGVTMVAIAVSIYQRVNLILHPGDEMTNIIRFKYTNGNAQTAQLINFLIPAIIILLIGIAEHHLVAVNIGTVFALFGQGIIIGIADRSVFPKLSHYHHY
ncbi:MULTISPECIES: hypothetical protein [unclassified Enterococcus]|uniref:hypothetical protein n=1 Tax=unclassified Enterococcus TaxID=2608891 RepID=UPI00155726FE|nr:MULTISPECIES: hypothetical protein [unclassified Enterococcus]MBS7577889.1 hypothetical protein [Enterococcus sp. MMGLQ5-2]MBS7585250.1 hypothetical protein [Enterococcus sp. MMGLQ5-1]NPD13107.1 hypothetical protein [Enterococcus sp. MMGLQ5-1]NPD37719.1 hypothetical protein [Enterococcus sp. MMGLQ5-2]